jgi:hypothetical protein
LHWLSSIGQDHLANITSRLLSSGLSSKDIAVHPNEFHLASGRETQVSYICPTMSECSIS